jgi:hypothetical protein
VKALHVTSRNGVAPFKGKDVGPDSIAKALSVGTIVSGTVAQSGDKVRVTVEMLDARTGSSIGTMEIEKTKADAFALQDTLVAEVSEALRKQVGQQFQLLTNKAGTRNAAAWEAFQLAKQKVTEGDSLLGSGDIPAATAKLASADTAFGVVAGQDAKWAAPLSQQGILKYRMARLSLGAPVASISPTIDAGLERAGKALAIAPNDPDALEARGSLRYLQWLLNLTPSGESDAAMAAVEADLRAAIKANPAQASAMNVLSHLLIVEGRTSDGKLMAGDAYKADPYLTDANKTVWRLFQASMDLDLTTETKKWCDEGARRFPADYRFFECRLWMPMLRGLEPKPTADQIWKAYDAFIEADKVDQPEFAKRKGMMLAAMGLNRAGLADSARSVIGRAQGDESVDPTGDLAYLEAWPRAVGREGQGDRTAVAVLRQKPSTEGVHLAGRSVVLQVAGERASVQVVGRHAVRLHLLQSAQVRVSGRMVAGLLHPLPQFGRREHLTAQPCWASRNGESPMKARIISSVAAAGVLALVVSCSEDQTRVISAHAAHRTARERADVLVLDGDNDAKAYFLARRTGLRIARRDADGIPAQPHIGGDDGRRMNVLAGSARRAERREQVKGTPTTGRSEQVRQRRAALHGVPRIDFTESLGPTGCSPCATARRRTHRRWLPTSWAPMASRFRARRCTARSAREPRGHWRRRRCSTAASNHRDVARRRGAVRCACSISRRCRRTSRSIQRSAPVSAT